NGPRDKNNRIENITENLSDTFDARFSTFPPFLFKAMIANNTRPTPVIKNPSIAIGVLSPASCPRTGAKITLPAPRNIANSINPIANICKKGIFFSIVKNLHYLIYHVNPSEYISHFCNKNLCSPVIQADPLTDGTIPSYSPICTVSKTLPKNLDPIILS